ncbi:hypothetical protein ACL02U_17995 [Streptomyces sp. MS06]|uniref:hypothetical protein n=1 Tax=Streptomyces sp. MS06 TaxID=3385974 RepID=UPI0039A3A770
MSFFADDPLLKRLHAGDRVTGTVWGGEVVAIAADGSRQRTGADPVNEPFGFVLLGSFLGVGGITGLGIGVYRLSASRRARRAGQR